MADVLNNTAIALLAEFILGTAPVDPILKLGLFVNNIVPICTTGFVALTQCSAAGYAEHTLVPGTWVIPAPISCAIDCSYPAVTFTLTNNGGGQTVYGHYVRDTNSDLLWTLAWATPWVIPVGGGVAQISPFYTSLQC